MVTKRDQGGKFERGHSGGPGRPRNAVTNALRRLHDPDKIATFLLGVISHPGSKMADRLKAAELVIDRLEGKSVTSTTMTLNTTPGLPSGWNAMSPAERIALLDRIELSVLAPATTPLDHLLEDGDDAEDEIEPKDANP